MTYHMTFDLASARIDVRPLKNSEKVRATNVWLRTDSGRPRFRSTFNENAGKAKQSYDPCPAVPVEIWKISMETHQHSLIGWSSRG